MFSKLTLLQNIQKKTLARKSFSNEVPGYAHLWGFEKFMLTYISQNTSGRIPLAFFLLMKLIAATSLF